MLVNDHQSAGQLAAAERRVTWELGFTAGATRSDLTAEGNRRASVAPNIGWPLGRTLSPYGLALSGAPLSGALGDASGLIDGESDGDGEPDGLGEGVATTGNAFAITLRILAIVAGVR